MRDLGSNWTYSVTQKIAQNATEPYDSFVFRDEIEECMKINSVKVINDQEMMYQNGLILQQQEIMLWHP